MIFLFYVLPRGLAKDLKLPESSPPPQKGLQLFRKKKCQLVWPGSEGHSTQLALLLGCF